MDILSKFKKNKKRAVIDKRNLDIGQRINLNILEFILEDQATFDFFKVLVSYKEPLQAFTIPTLKSKMKSKFSDKYFSKVLEPLVLLNLLKKSCIKLEGDKRAKTYYKLDRSVLDKLNKQINFKTRNYQEELKVENGLSKDCFQYKKKLGIPYVLSFFIRSSIGYNFKELETLVLNRKEVYSTTVKLKLILENLVNIGLLEKKYYQNEGDKRVKLYYHSTSLGDKLIREGIKPYL